MKHITLLLVFVLTQTIASAQESTKIPFDKGVLKICSSKNFIIKGYDGNEVIIKNLYQVVEGRLLYKDSYNNMRNKFGNVIYRTIDSTSSASPLKGSSQGKTGKAEALTSGKLTVKGKDSTYVGFFKSIQDKNRSKGLRKLGKKAEAEASGIYLLIEQNGNELIIKDRNDNLLMMSSNEKYEITIPNSISLNWNTNGCDENTNSFFHSKTSELKNFKGEVEISSALNELHLTDVSGPVSINTIGGNVIIEFDKTTPKYLYSIYSNNGLVDIKLPIKSNMLIEATGAEIMSDLDFTVVSEKEKNGAQQMHLKLGTGGGNKVNMKIDAGLGNIYLRKQ